MPTIRLPIVLSFAFAVAGCSLPPVSSWPPAGPSDRAAAGTAGRWVEVGTASWYGPGFHGNRTSSGEIYNQHDMTAAHQTLPLGTRVAVTNLENGRVVEVTVNDRGPFVKGRIIDLSYAAAHELHVVDPGTARVRVEVVGDAASTVRPVAYAVQAGAFRDLDKAGFLRTTLASSYRDVYTSPLETAEARYYRVRLGPFDRREDAALRAQELVQTGLPAVIVEELRP